MPLDDFFAKKEKKKSKKKKNPQSLIEKLTKDGEKLQEQEGDVPAEVAKVSITLGKEDEWNTLDDEEKDIDLQNIRIGKLEVGGADETTKQASKQLTDKEGVGETEGEKKVWSFKALEACVDEQEPEPKPEAEPPRPKLFIPVHLRPKGSNLNKAAKPNVSSDADFPTLDVAATAEPVVKKPDEKIPNDDDDGSSWEQAGAPRKSVRPADTLPITIKPSPSGYVPPSLRSGGGHGLTQHHEVSSDFRDGRSRDEGSQRFGGVGSGFRRENYAPRETYPPRETYAPRDSALGWRRGETIPVGGFNVANAPSGTSFATRLPSPPRPAMAPTHATNSGWPQGVNVKTFRAPTQEKDDFDLVQTNRFAGLSET